MFSKYVILSNKRLKEVIVCTSYTLHTSNQYLEKEVKIFLDEMLNNKEKEITMAENYVGKTEWI